MSEYDIHGAISLYNMDRWGDGYFTISACGNIVVLPTRNPGRQIDLYALVNEARNRGLSLPLVVRFQDLLRDRVKSIHNAFISAIEEAGYRNVYRGVFPIKVNQLREVVEEILDAGSAFHIGLEVGSKAELMAALAIHTDPQSLIVCNGYKDKEFIRMALLGRKLGKQIIIIIEKLEELHHVLHLAEEIGMEPHIGMRVRLQSEGAGKWATSGGINAKFGLSTADLVTACDLLNSVGKSNFFKLLHFHVGSQVPDIGTVKRVIREAARFYSKLQKMGYDITYLDVGGGLGVDYDGSKTASSSSTNYTLSEYTRDIVYNIMEVCDSEGVTHPIIVSESGRATVAHHSVLIVEAFSSIEKNSRTPVKESSAEDPNLVEAILEIRENLYRKNCLENLHDAQQIREQAQAMFDLGLLELRPKAKIETIYWEIAAAIVEQFRSMRYIPGEIKEIESILGDQFICNFSVFQSLLDHWALGQLFPVLPIHRLHEPPDRNGTLVDITCDSDGKVGKFIDLHNVKETLPMHRFRPEEPYFLGFFLVGAYQDIMGDLHNLFGRVNEIHVFMDEDEDTGYYIEEYLPGSNIGQVLSLTQWDVNELIRRMKTQTDAAIKSDKLKPNEGMRLLNEYEKGFSSYTYLQLEK